MSDPDGGLYKTSSSSSLSSSQVRFTCYKHTSPHTHTQGMSSHSLYKLSFLFSHHCRHSTTKKSSLFFVVSSYFQCLTPPPWLLFKFTGFLFFLTFFSLIFFIFFRDIQKSKFCQQRSCCLACQHQQQHLPRLPANCSHTRVVENSGFPG